MTMLVHLGSMPENSPAARAGRTAAIVFREPAGACIFIAS
jgi:hypothetical protein